MKSTSRDRDQGRKYKSGSNKRKAKANNENKINELPKITSFLKNDDDLNSRTGLIETVSDIVSSSPPVLNNTNEDGKNNECCSCPRTTSIPCPARYQIIH